MTSTLPTGQKHARQGPEPATLGPPSVGNNALVKLFVAIPFAALVAAAPFAWGWGLSWLDVGLALVLLLPHRHRRHRRLPPATSPTARSRPAAALRVGLAVARQHGLPGPGHHVGGRPPPPPRLRRQGGRPALALAVRDHPGRAGQGLLPRPHRLDARRASAPTRPASPPTCSPTPTSPGSTASSRCWTVVSLAAPAAARRVDQLVLVGSADRVLLGRAGPRRRSCTTSRGRSTRSAT